MVGFEKVLGAVKVIKDQIQYRSQSLLNLARDYFSVANTEGGLEAPPPPPSRYYTDKHPGLTAELCVCQQC